MEIPNLISISCPAASINLFTVSWASNNETCVPQVMATMAFLAPVIDASSNGELMALLAASLALFGPLPKPNPIRATPESLSVLLTSAKSKLITAGKRIKLTTVLTD